MYFLDVKMKSVQNYQKESVIYTRITHGEWFNNIGSNKNY